jgi:hypothetical protein
LGAQFTCFTSTKKKSASTDTEGAAEEEDSHAAEDTLQQSYNRAATELQQSCNGSVMRKRSRSPLSSPTDAHTRPPPGAPPLLRRRPAVPPEVLEAHIDR